MKIALCSIGSRGDVEPFLVLGEFFSKQGYNVRVCSASMYTSLAKNYNLEYLSFEGDYESIMDDEALKKALGKNPLLISKNLEQKVYPIIEYSLQAFYNMLHWADYIIYHPKTLIDSISYKQEHKLIKAYVVPLFTATKEFKNPILSFLPMPKVLYKDSYKINELAIRTVKKPILNFRKKEQLPFSPFFVKSPTMYGISSSFISPPKDYPKNHVYTGFWYREVNSKIHLDKEVQTFFKKERRVLIITFGSMPFVSKIGANQLIQYILDNFPLDLLVVKARGLKHVDFISNDRVLSIDSAPYEHLFPLADYVMHHGGAGTTSHALKAGIPQFICPVLYPFGDQLFWGKQVELKGLGVAPVPLKKLSLETLKKSIQQLMQLSLKKNAQIMKQKIKNENGLLKANSFVEKISLLN